MTRHPLEERLWRLEPAAQAGPEALLVHLHAARAELTRLLAQAALPAAEATVRETEARFAAWVAAPTSERRETLLADARDLLTRLEPQDEATYALMFKAEALLAAEDLDVDTLGWTLAELRHARTSSAPD